MADPISTVAQVEAYIASSAQDSCWKAEECRLALEQARNTPVPSSTDENWRKTDPNAFPWDAVEAVDAVRTRRDFHLRALGIGESCGLVPLAARDDCERCRTLSETAGDAEDAKFLHYHKTFSRMPACFRVPRGFRGDPAELIQQAWGPGLLTFTTMLLIERGAEAVIYDRWEVERENSPIVGRVEIFLEEGAALTFIQEDAVAPTSSLYRRARVRLEKDARLFWYSMTSGAAWHVNRIDLDLNGAGSEAVIKGLFAGAGEARADHRTHQHHSAPSAKSELIFKTLLAGRAHSVFQGLITVPKQSQKTDAYQQCRNLLLESGPHADAIPKLEIIADDVRCSHGASMGSVNKDQLFYLQTRGLSRREATVVIATGFAEEIIRHIPLTLVQQRWRDLVAETVGKLEAA